MQQAESVCVFCMRGVDRGREPSALLATKEKKILLENTTEDVLFDPLAGSPSYVGHPLREWQKRALNDWEDAGYRGVVEAVTGTGKSLVGIAAIHQTVVRAGGKALVLVPTVALVEQWRQQVARSLPTLRVGTLGGGERTKLRDVDVLISTVQSAHKNPPEPTSLGVLIADEVHRYGSATFAKALSARFERRLGLSGTFERQLDNGIEEILVPYFGPVITSYQYGEALEEGVVAPFHLAFVGTHFTRYEQRDYDEATRKCDDARLTLTRNYDYPSDWPLFFAHVNAVATSARKANYWDDEANLCSMYLSGFSKRREITAQASAKEELLAGISESFLQRSGTLVFTETKDSALRLAHIANKEAAAYPLTSDSSSAVRRDKLAAFGHGTLKVLCAPRILDEGIDVPEAEIAVIIAASSTRRQMIQRMGRVIRKKKDERSARILIAYVIGTGEDPALGGHEAFLDQITEHASSRTMFSDQDLDGIREWLAN